jgi:hypothetical protein
MSTIRRNNVDYFMMKEVNTCNTVSCQLLKKIELLRRLGTDKYSGTTMYKPKKPNLKGINFLPTQVQDLGFLRFSFKIFQSGLARFKTSLHN